MSLFRTVTRFASSPQGRAAIAKAKEAANDPRNRQKLEDLVGKAKEKGRDLQARGQGPGQATGQRTTQDSDPSTTPPPAPSDPDSLADRPSDGPEAPRV